MALAKVVNLASATDKTVILNVRCGVIQPFQAPNWLDLRVGFLLSVTKATDDDDTTGLSEEINPNTSVADRMWIGVKTRDDAMPRTVGTVFAGWTTGGPGPHDGFGHSKLVTSDLAIGTSNAYFWRPKNTDNDLYGCAMLLNGAGAPRITTDGTQQHFVQNAGGAGGYATLLMLRLQRPDTEVRGKLLTVTMKTGTHSGDVLFTNTPTKALLNSNLEAFPSTVQQLGPMQVSAVPDALYLYWPFHDSRLRIHAMGIVKVR